MKYEHLPSPTLAKLLSLEEVVEHLTQHVAKTQDGITSARARLSGGFNKPTEGDDLAASLKQLIADKPILEQKLHAARSVLSNAKSWLDALPENAKLELVKIDVDGHDLGDIQTRLQAAHDELMALKAMPTSSADIEQRVRAYVAGLSKPEITGIGPGQKLKVLFPGAGWDERGTREHRAEVLPLIALIFPNEMTAALLREIERMTSDVIPLKDRASKIAALERELAELAYVEEALVAAAIADGEDVQRSPGVPPAAVLGVGSWRQ
jgi:hypothetical protein